ncbi:hypothetical protein ABPG75_003813 [Micractinium tetrahymenae]
MLTKPGCPPPGRRRGAPWPTWPAAHLPLPLSLPASPGRASALQEAGRIVGDVASAMVHVGLEPHSRASVFGANSPEWMITMQACNRNTVYCVPLYDVLGDNTVEYIIDRSESSIVFVAADKLPVLAKAMHKVERPVGNVVYWGKPSAAAQSALEEIRGLGPAVHSFDDFAALGREHPAPPAPPKIDDVCTIMYTSGTTGTPKGVLLTHRAVSSEVASLRHWITQVGSRNVYQSGVYLSFLPMAHIYGRCVEEMFLTYGVAIAYWSGEAKGLPADIRACQPTIFCSVPKIFERFESSARDKIKKAGGAQEKLFEFAFKAKLNALKAGWPWDKLASAVFDPLVFKEVSRNMLGDRLLLIVSGGAPLARHIEEFMRVAGCAIFVQGYGLTETCAATFVSYPDTPCHLYTVGPPQPAFQVRLEAVPDMDYDPAGTPPRGEVLVRGGGLFSGYYKDENETRKAMDADGWFHTGDVGELSPCGALRIIDRKKNIFKLSQGEYIAVEKIEGVLDDSPLVDQIWVHGSRFESCLVAVVVPSRGRLETWAREQNIDGSFAELCADSCVKRMVLRELETTGKRGGLKSFELPKSILLEPSHFSVANDLLTPTMELRRHQLLRKYGPAIDEMYDVMKQRQQCGGGGGDGRPNAKGGPGKAAGEGKEAAGAGAGDGGRRE